MKHESRLTILTTTISLWQPCLWGRISPVLIPPNFIPWSKQDSWLEILMASITLWPLCPRGKSPFPLPSTQDFPEGNR
jgi:hypothetical protein